jgi:hypothetical protein
MGSGSSSQDSPLGDSDEPVGTDSEEDTETEVDRVWVSEVERVLRHHIAQHPEHLTADPSSLIGEGVFQKLNREPTAGEVEEAQCRVLGM